MTPWGLPMLGTQHRSRGLSKGTWIWGQRILGSQRGDQRGLTDIPWSSLCFYNPRDGGCASSLLRHIGVTICLGLPSGVLQDTELKSLGLEAC
jgi:hypothetical protein